jgi:succinoglycan biosynthesis transport protein ExoP
MEPRAEHPGMELRTYLAILRRRRLLIAIVTLLVGTIAFLSSNLQSPVYSAEAKILLLNNDPAEQIDQASNPALSGTEADRYLAAQLDVIRSERIAEDASRLVPKSTGKGLLRQIKARQAGTTDIIVITANDADPKRAAVVANAFATTYIENRRLNEVRGLDKAIDEIGAKLDDMTARIADLDSRIHAANLAAQKAAAKRPGVTAADLAEPAVSAESETLTSARSAATVQYQSLYAQQQTLLVNKSLKKGEAQLIEEAKAPSAPASPRPKRTAAIGLGFGLLLGLVAAFLREQLDDRIHSREQAEEMTKLPVLAELPEDGDAAKDSTRLPAHESPAGPLAEASRGLRTSLTFLGVDKPLRRIVVTSAGPGEGKSFVTANLAAVYAQAGLRTVIVSADLRRPRIDTIFPEAANQGPGMTGVITAFAKDPTAPTPMANGHGAGVNGNGSGSVRVRVLAEAVRPTRVENLFLVPAGVLPPNPAEILSSTWCDQVLDALGDIADVVLIDAPPTLVVTDPALLATKADGVMIVAAASETERGALVRATATLAKSHARLLGIVLNKVDISKSSSYYGYGTYASEPVKTAPSRWSWRRRNDEHEGGSASDVDSVVGAGRS